MDIKRDPPKKTKQLILGGAGIVLLAAVTVGVARLQPAVPAVDHPWIDSVRRGDMVRAVGAAGNLVPEHVRIITALNTGRVESIPLRPGAIVTPTTLLVELSNPDLTSQILNDDQQLAAALQGQASLKTTLRSGLLSEELTVAGLETQYRAAVRGVALADSGTRPGYLMAANDAAAARDHLIEVTHQLDIEKRRYEDMKADQVEQISLNEQALERTKAIVDDQRQRALSLRVTAGEDGVLKSINLELGQYVSAGAELARIVRPDLLKAELRVPESQATDVAIGQTVSIDLHNNTTAHGHVMRIDPSATAGTVTVDVSIDAPMPVGARADQSVDGTIEIEKLTNVLHVGRPVNGQAESTVSLFVLTPDGKFAVRKQVKLGKTSVSTVQVLDGLSLGDRIITTDMGEYENAARVKIKN